MNFLDGALFPENQDKLSDAIGLENALALTPLACIIAAFVVARNLSKVQSVDQRMRLGMRVGFRQLRTCPEGPTSFIPHLT